MKPVSVPVQIGGQVRWTVRPSASCGGWVAECAVLNLTAEGDTYGELLDDIRGVMNDLFAFLMRSGELDDYLRRLGWQSHDIVIPIPAGSTIDNVMLDVPFALDLNPGSSEQHA